MVWLQKDGCRSYFFVDLDAGDRGDGTGRGLSRECERYTSSEHRVVTIVNTWYGVGEEMRKVRPTH